MPGGILIQLHVQPGASKTELAGRHGDALKIRVASPPAEGKANRELIRYLAEILEVPQGVAADRAERLLGLEATH